MIDKTHYLHFHGIDQAKSPDFMTIFINRLGPKPKDNSPWLPKLRDVYRFHHDNYEHVLKWYLNTVCRKYYPTMITIDVTNNSQMGDSILNKFGKRKVDAQRFQNVGSSNTKYELKQIGLDYLKMGYTFPDPEDIVDQEKSEIIRELKQQMLRELTKLTKSGRITFDHPQGKKNDNVHGWELSLKGVMDYQKNKFEFFNLTGSLKGATYTRNADTVQLKQEEIQKRMFKRFKNSSLNIVSTKISVDE